MAYKLSDDLADQLLTEMKSALDGGFLHFFAGTVPNSPEEALDMANTHTLLCVLTEGGDGTTGLTFAAPSGAMMEKNDTEDWEGIATFDGAEDTETTLEATFFRFCTPGDNGQGAGAAPRLQGTIGPTFSGADMERDDPNITATEPLVIGEFVVRVSSVVA